MRVSHGTIHKVCVLKCGRGGGQANNVHILVKEIILLSKNVHGGAGGWGVGEEMCYI